jgi:sulfite dehydrogenase (cytochrome) subunit B
MSSLQRITLFLAAILIARAVAVAQKASIHLPADNAVSQLRSGPGEDVARKNCNFCHSTDYIVRQPHLTAEQWDAEVKKMIGVYGAPINATEARIIADYLGKNYGSEKGESKRTDARTP